MTLLEKLRFLEHRETDWAEAYRLAGDTADAIVQWQKLVREAYEFVHADLPNDGLSKLLELMDAMEMPNNEVSGGC